ncbi:hypothetical protein BVRB_017010 [Beta vulgaris subsp. vulgaris]|uniref:Uncharacterized protein n=1 Tax=Beta vulgaris subsp. vulgaris TaxID=3555 RepID=A0A0J8B458_BETVV|nr:hypothetical protein BVRB_017010 [Beta vulgaris subsp. vulgaris]
MYAMKKKKEAESLTNIKGFTPILVAFFLYRIPKLQTQLGVQVEERSTPSLLLSPVLSALRDVCHVKRGIDTKTRVVFNDLKNEETSPWKPWNSKPRTLSTKQPFSSTKP